MLVFACVCVLAARFQGNTVWTGDWTYLAGWRVVYGAFLLASTGHLAHNCQHWEDAGVRCAPGEEVG